MPSGGLGELCRVIVRVSVCTYFTDAPLAGKLTNKSLRCSKIQVMNHRATYDIELRAKIKD